MSSDRHDPPKLGRPPKLHAPLETIRKEAARLFAERGYEGTSLMDIAGAVKVTKAGIYHYFATKQEIFDAIVLQLLSDMRDEALRAIDQEPDPEGQLRAFMTCHAAFISRNLSEFRTMFGSRGGQATPYTSEQIAARLAYEKILRDILLRGAASGSLLVEDVPINGRAILGMLNWMSRWYAAEGEKSPTQIAAIMGSLVLEGMLPRG